MPVVPDDRACKYLFTAGETPFSGEGCKFYASNSMMQFNCRRPLNGLFVLMRSLVPITDKN